MINHDEWTEKASHKCTQLQMRFIINICLGDVRLAMLSQSSEGDTADHRYSY